MAMANLEKTAQLILNASDCPEAEISIVIVDDGQMAELNQTYRDRSGPTNVLAFAMRDGEFPEISPELLGDVIISADTAKREAARDRIPLSRRMTQLLVHGMLHLLGYDHERSEDEAGQMAARSGTLLAAIEAADPALLDG
jgi:probable rRNA maturation factor